MTRRALLRLAAFLATTWPLSSIRGLAASLTQATPLTSDHLVTLLAVADVVLPSSLTTDERQAAVTTFAEWVANYREGAEIGAGYGVTRLRTTGPAPTAGYPAQFAALDASARALGAPSLAALGVEARRGVIETALTSPQRITQLPVRPTGQHVITDFMGLFLHGPDGYNLAYRASIDREDCRGLDGSEAAPAPWPRRSGDR